MPEPCTMLVSKGRGQIAKVGNKRSVPRKVNIPVVNGVRRV